MHSKQIIYQNWDLDMFLDGYVPHDMIGYFLAPDQRGWKNTDRQPTSLLTLDIDNTPVEEVWHYFDNECGVTPVAAYQSAGGGGAHAVFQLDDTIRTSAEARHAYKRLAAMSDLEVDLKAAGNQIRYFRPGRRSQRINAPSNVSSSLLRLDEVDEKKKFSPKQVDRETRSPGTGWFADAMARVDIVLQEYKETMSDKWEAKGYQLHRDAERPQLIPVSPMERTPGGFRLNSTGQLSHFNRTWGKQLLSPHKHAGRFDPRWSWDLIQLFAESRSKAVLIMHRLLEVQVLGSRVPAYEILQVASKKETFVALGWNYMSQQDIRDPVGRKYASAREAIAHHQSLVKGGLLPGCLVTKGTLSRFLDLLVARLKRGKQFGHKMAKRLMDAVSRQQGYLAARQRIEIKDFLQHGISHEVTEKAVSHANHSTGPPRSSGYPPQGDLLPC